MGRFGHACPQCSNGTVKETEVKDYEARINNRTIIIPKAIVGICDNCHAISFDSQERRKWEGMFYQRLETRLLSAQQIALIRKKLGLNAFDFAILVGTDSYTLSRWEDPQRSSSQPLIADILLRLIIQSINKGQIDLLLSLQNRTKAINVPVLINLKRRHHDKTV